MLAEYAPFCCLNSQKLTPFNCVIQQNIKRTQVILQISYNLARYLLIYLAKHLGVDSQCNMISTR